MARGFWAKGLPAVALALALMGGGARGQSSNAFVMCAVITASAPHIMDARQSGMPREDMDKIIAGMKDGPTKGFNEWMVQKAYSIDISVDPSAVPKVIEDFKQMADSECMTLGW